MNDRLTWLLDEQQEESGASDLTAAIEAAGGQYVILSRREARQGSDRLTALHAAPTLAYGSIEFTKAIPSDFYPGRWCDWTALRCEQYYSRLGAMLFNDDYILLPAAEIRRRLPQLPQTPRAQFLRPARADKPFSGFVVRTDNAEEIDRRLERMEAHDLVVVASAKEIEAEYRTVAVRGAGIVAASQYMQDGLLHVAPDAPAEAVRAADAVVKTVGADFPDPMFVVDIAQCGDEYLLVEINGFSFSCYYACDLEAIVLAAHTQAMREWRDVHA